MIEAAMIFAAGLGTRMGALTEETPKPMLPLLGRPMVDYTIDHLRSAGMARVVANTHYLSDKIKPHLEQLGVTVLHEDPILETGGGLRAARDALASDPVVTINPDMVWIGPNPVSEITAAWRNEMQALLMLVPSPDGSETDNFSLEHGQISRSGFFRYTGLQIVRTDRLDEIPDQVFSLNAYWDLLAKTGPLHGTVYSGQWRDIGTAEGLRQAEKVLR